jgi:hypothetical protein
MRRIASLACLFLSANSAKASSDRRHVLQKATDSLRPQSHITRVEKYRYESEENAAQSLQNLHKSNDIAGVASSKAESARIQERKRLWRGFDAMDKEIFATALPLSAVFAIIPFAGALDLFWLNRLGDALAVAGQAAANQVYNSAFWLFAFLPMVTATLVSKSHASGDIEKTQEAVGQALLFAVFISAAGTSLMFLNPAKALSSILKGK